MAKLTKEEEKEKIIKGVIEEARKLGFLKDDKDRIMMSLEMR